MLEHAVDGLIVALLFALLVLGALLLARLRRLRGQSGELRAMVDALNDAVEAADRALGSLKRAALEAGAGMAAERERAGRIVDDLRLLSERADREADRLSDLIGEVRACGAPAAPPAGVRRGGQEQLERTLRSLR